MKGWIILGIAVGTVYYFATETDKLDKPIAQAESALKTVERKVESMTGTTIIKVDKRVENLKAELASRLSTKEITALDELLTDTHSIEDFKEDFCENIETSTGLFTKENLRYICDSL